MAAATRHRLRTRLGINDRGAQHLLQATVQPQKKQTPGRWWQRHMCAQDLTGATRSNAKLKRVVQHRLAWPCGGSCSPASARGRVSQPFSTSPAACGLPSLLSRRSLSTPPKDTARLWLALRGNGFTGWPPASPAGCSTAAGAATRSAAGCPSGEAALSCWVLRLSGAMPGAEFLLRSSATCARHACEHADYAHLQNAAQGKTF